MKQKVIKIGSSIGVVLSKPMAEEVGFKAGQEVQLHLQGKGVFVEPAAPQVERTVDPAILEWTDEFISKNRELLERLKNK